VRYEHRTDRLLTRKQFANRLLGHLSIAGAVVVFSLGIGAAGYHFTAELPWLDSLLNASMILAGMGPVADLRTAPAPAKCFATIYALYSGLVFLVVAGILLAPVAHRVLHKLHLEGGADRSSKSS
jgi:hypothetical protein